MRRIPIADRELAAEYADLRVQVLSLAARDTARNLESPSCTRMIGLHDSPLEGTGFEPSVPLLGKGLSAVAEPRCRTDKIDEVIRHRSSRETTVVERGPLSTAVL